MLEKKSKPGFSASRVVLAASVGAAMQCMPAKAGTFIWNNTSDNWSDATAWGGTTPPASDPTTSLVFGDGATAYNYIADNDIGPMSLNNLSVNAGAGGLITLSSSSGPLTFAGTSPAIWLASGSAAISAPIVDVSGMQITNAGSGTLTLGAQTFAGTVNITNQSTGTVALSDAVTYAGSNVTINLANSGGGTFTIGNMGAVSGTLNITSGAVAFSGSTAGDLFGNSMILNVAAGASFDFAGNPETMGGITGSGTVFLGNATVGAAGVTFTEAGDRTFNGVFTGTGAVSQNVANVLTLGGSNTYNGTTTVEGGGTIRAAAANVLSPNSLVSIVANAGKLDLGGFSQTIGGLTGGTGFDTIAIGGSSTLTINAVSTTARTYTGGFSGTGNLVFGLASGVASETQSILGNNTYTGSTTVNAGTLRLNATNLPTGGGVNIAAGATLDAILPSDASWTAPLSGSGSFMKDGAGAITFASANPGANLSNLSIRGGSVVLGDTSTNGGQIGAAPALTLGSGALSLLGNAGSASSQTFNGLTLQGGATIGITSGANQNAAISIGSITRAPGLGGTINFLPNNVGSGVASINTTTTNDSMGILGAYAIVNGTDWAVGSPDGSSKPVTALPAASYMANTWATGTHTDVTTSLSPASATSTADVRFNTPGAATVTLSGTNPITEGGILVTPNVGANALSITGGTITAPANQDLVINQFNPAAALTVASVIGNTAGTAVAQTVATLGTTTTMTVPSTAGLYPGMIITAGTNIPATDNAHIISVNSATSLTISFTTAPTAGSNVAVTFTPGTNVVKAGPGQLILTGTNTFNGLLVLEGGVTTVGAEATAGAKSNGTSSIYLNGGTLEETASVSPGSAGQPLFMGPAGGTIQVDGAFNYSRQGNSFFGTGPLTKTGSGTLQIGSNGSSYTGQTTVDAGDFRFTSSQFGSAGSVTINSGGQYEINDNATATFGFSAGSILTLNGDGPSGATNAGAFILTVQSGGTQGPITTFNGTNSVFLASNARIGTYNNFGFTSSLIIAGPVTGPGGLTKDGPGSLTLSNANNAYLGTTVVSNGTLLLGGNNALPVGTTLQFGETTSSNVGTFDLNKFNQTVAALTTAGTGGPPQIINSGSGTPTLTINYAGTSPDAFAGQIGGGNTSSPSNNSLSVTKSGFGTLVLTGANTLNGNVTVQGGTLLVNGQSGGDSGTGNATVAINSGGTLGGNGAAIGSVNVNSSGIPARGGIISAGDSMTTATLTTGPQTWNGGSDANGTGGGTYAWKLNVNNAGSPGTVNFDASGANWDQLTMSSLTVTASPGGTFNIQIIGLSGAGGAPFNAGQSYQWEIANVMPGGSISGVSPSMFKLTTVNLPGVSPNAFSVDTSTDLGMSDPTGSTDLILTYTPTPEPTSLALFGVVAGGLLLRRRRKA